jgi:hypothetical protein
MVCGVNRLESAGQRRRRGEQHPEGADVDDLALRQRHLNQPFIPSREVCRRGQLVGRPVI